MGLCEACVHCTQKLLRWHMDGPRMGWMWTSADHLSFLEILLSAPSCDLCYLLKESCMRRIRAYHEELLGEEALLNYLKTRMSDKRLILSLSADFGSEPYDHLNVGSYAVGFSWDLEIWAATGSSSDRRGYISDIPPIRQDDSGESYDLIRTWFSGCRANHTRCNTTISNYPIDESLIKLPTRVIDVSPDQDPGHVILIQTHGERGHYAALSHCWGPPSKKPLQTTEETLSQHEHGIEIKKLPKTFRDAVMVTREIGIRYLWIDSLCIVQQDKAEWNHEVLRMGEIFEKAQVVIAATTARDSSEGLFMSGRHLTDPILKLRYRPNKGNRDQEVMVSFSASGLPHRIDCLWDRGWTFQEKHLARRMLIFGKSGIFWTCKITGRILGDRGRSYQKWNPLGKSWLDDVKDYCWKGLTYEHDRLMAIEGLARELEKTRSDTYEFGVWSSEAHETLSWIVDRPSRGVPSGSRVPGIPSWSWASVTGSKIFPQDRGLYRNHFTPPRTETKRLNNAGSQKRNILAEITFNSGKALSIKSHLKRAFLSPGCRCLSNTNESLDKPSNGHIESECNQNSSRRDDFWFFSDRETQALNMRDFSSESVGWAYFDEKSVENFLCLLLHEVGGKTILKGWSRKLEGHPEGSLYYIALLLKQVRGTESFRRVGLGLITMSSWFDGGPLLCVSII